MIEATRTKHIVVAGDVVIVAGDVVIDRHLYAGERHSLIERDRRGVREITRSMAPRNRCSAR